MTGGKHTILVLDDEPNIVRSLQDLLRLDYRVLGTATAQEAMSILACEDVHVVVADQRMPETTGVEFLREVRHRYPDVVRLLMTGYSDLAAVIEAVNIGGIFRYLPKPCDPQHLLETILEACKWHDTNATRGRKGEMDLFEKAAAAAVQRHSIPAQAPTVPGFQLGAFYAPSVDLAGDFYDFFELPAENLAMAICDVTGTGLAASLLMMSIRASLRAHASMVYDMRQVIANVNRELCCCTSSGQFASMFYGVLDWSARKLTYLNAGHWPALLLDGQVSTLGIGGPLLGLDAASRYQVDSVVLRPGAVLVAYTDGLVDLFNSREEKFGLERILASAQTCATRGADAETIVRTIMNDAAAWAGPEKPEDDISLLVVKAV